MRLAILSDIHDNLVNLDICLRWLRQEKIKKIIFCGDLTNAETLDRFAANFTGEIFIIRGNIELYEATQLSAYPHLRDRGQIGREIIGSLKIAFCHEPKKIETILKDAAAPEPDFIFYGHTHKPWIEKRGAIIIANPGNLAGSWHQATFAVLDTETKKLELKIMTNL